MATIEKHAPGTFCWFELATTDQPAAKAFYANLFGWTPVDNPMGPGAVYTTFKLEGLDAAAAYNMQKEQRDAGILPNWMVYIAVDNADAKAKLAAELGGKVHIQPFDVMEHGRMAVVEDPTGAVFSIWQPKHHLGSRIGGVNGTFCWADLSTPDTPRAQEFYSKLFGWEMEAGAHDPFGYLHISSGGAMIGGVAPAAHRNPNEPPHWLLYFLVDDVDATAAKAQQSGTQTLVAPMTMENVGRMAVLADPQGAAFAIFKSAR